MANMTSYKVCDCTCAICTCCYNSFHSTLFHVSTRFHNLFSLKSDVLQHSSSADKVLGWSWAQAFAITAIYIRGVRYTMSMIKIIIHRTPFDMHPIPKLVLINYLNGSKLNGINVLLLQKDLVVTLISLLTGFLPLHCVYG